MSPRSPRRPRGVRPKGFYFDWSVFSVHALSWRARRAGHGRDDDLAVVLLAGGAVLGEVGLAAIAAANAEAESKDKESGAKPRSPIANVGSAFVGAAIGTFGAALLTRALARKADTAKVDALQARLGAARREFEVLKREAAQGRINEADHRSAVERLFDGLWRSGE